MVAAGSRRPDHGEAAQAVDRSAEALLGAPSQRRVEPTSSRDQVWRSSSRAAHGDLSLNVAQTDTTGVDREARGHPGNRLSAPGIGPSTARSFTDHGLKTTPRRFKCGLGTVQDRRPQLKCGAMVFATSALRLTRGQSHSETRAVLAQLAERWFCTLRCAARMNCVNSRAISRVDEAAGTLASARTITSSSLTRLSTTARTRSGLLRACRHLRGVFRHRCPPTARPCRSSLRAGPRPHPRTAGAVRPRSGRRDRGCVPGTG